MEEARRFLAVVWFMFVSYVVGAIVLSTSLSAPIAKGRLVSGQTVYVAEAHLVKACATGSTSSRTTSACADYTADCFTTGCILGVLWRAIIALVLTAIWISVLLYARFMYFVTRSLGESSRWRASHRPARIVSVVASSFVGLMWGFVFAGRDMIIDDILGGGSTKSWATGFNLLVAGGILQALFATGLFRLHISVKGESTSLRGPTSVATVSPQSPHSPLSPMPAAAPSPAWGNTVSAATNGSRPMIHVQVAGGSPAGEARTSIAAQVSH